ncbi:MAG TPA: choice-of-anchor T family protein [Candidatus Thermoplasmatota archaeon]|nr:choice-of-anchor T family protein [Candidatus Thermoplasmatota archaeon]
MGARHHQTRWAAATSLLFILASGAAVFPAGAAPLAPAPPSCQVNLALDQVVAHPTSSVSDSMTFAGTVDVNLGSLSGSRNLALEASATVADWPASVSPATENVSTVEQVPFNATLVVPAMEDAATRGTLTVTASFLAVPGLPGTAVTCSDSLSVTVAQYYGVSADIADARMNLTTGPQGIAVSVILDNLGNGRDSFTIDVEDKVGLDIQGIHLRLPITVPVDPGAQTSATFTVNATSDAKEDVYELTVNVRSQGQPQTAFTTVRLTLVVRSGDILAALPEPSTMLILGAVGAGALGALVLRRRLKRNRAARGAREQLKKVLKQKREAEAAAGAPELPQADAGAPEPPASPSADSRVRVRVKAPPRP